MKYLIFSDVHGSYYYGKKIIEMFNKEKADKLILLGDILYHGPRNNLPRGHNPKKLVQLLNTYKDSIIAVEGNCDADIDHVVLEFEIKPEVDEVMNGKKVHLEHGHHLDKSKDYGDIVFFGHFHVHEIVKAKSILVNPGSVSLPKNKQKPSYAIFDDKGIYIKDLKGKVLSELIFD